jgi:competence protein ComEA
LPARNPPGEDFVDPSSAPWRAFEAPESPAPSAERGAAGSGVSPEPAVPAIPRAILFGALAAMLLLGVGAAALAAGGHDAAAVVVGGGASAGPDKPGVGSPDPGRELVVDVGGAVLRPGVYHLSTGARVGDAIAAAGGYGPRVDAARAGEELNLAALLQDGQHVQVPSRDDGAGGGGGGTGPGSSAGPGSGGANLVDLNHATEAELEALPGIGPATAAKIIASREGTRFVAVQDLRDRKLVGQKAFDGLKDLVTIR